MGNSWWLDLKLGARMLGKHPGLALAGGVGIAVAVAIAAGGFSVVRSAFLVRALPFAGGDRIVSLEVWDAAANRAERRLGHDFAAWREELRSVEELGSFRMSTANLTAPGAQAGTARMAAMGAAGFRVTGVAPLLGRTLLESDERAGAAAVAVIGEELWRNRFGGDAGIVGRTVRLGAAPYTVVGVMPAGYAFPVNQNVWVPLAAGAAGPLEGPELLVFGRLAAGATIESAQAELTAWGRRRAVERADLYGQLRPRVLPYAFPFAGLHEAGDAGGMILMEGLAGALLVLVSLNVAILVYARTAMRQGEIAVRTALGASRARIVGQMFLEALVLAGLAAGVGVAVAAAALRSIGGALRGVAEELPFWISFDLSPGAVAWAGGLSVLAAAIVGVLPGLQATRGQVSEGLRRIGTGGSGLRLGPTWTALVVAQVGFAVAILPGATFAVWELLRAGLADPGAGTEAILTARVEWGGRLGELLRQLEADPRLAGVTFATAVPGDEPAGLLEVEGDEAARHEARWNRVDRRFFETFGVGVLAGRTDGLVVNESAARRLFGGGALGRRVRLGSGEWREVVGIVRDFPAGAASRGLADSKLRVYEPVEAETAGKGMVAMRVRGEAGEFAGRLREVAAGVDAEAELRDVLRMDEVLRREGWIRLLEGGVFAAVTLSVLLLSAAGIYALMSLAVTQRRKEIGIRTALGADAGRLVGSIFGRAMRQLGVGVAVGVVGAAALERAVWGKLDQENAVLTVSLAVAIFLAVGLLGAAGPARRMLRLAPTEALRAD